MTSPALVICNGCLHSVPPDDLCKNCGEPLPRNACPDPVAGVDWPAPRGTTHGELMRLHQEAENTVPAPADTTTAILNERGSRYGKFADHARIAQTIKFAIQNHMGAKWHDMRPDQREALEMIAHKIGRIANGDPDYEDSWRDIAGYAQLVADRLKGVSR